MLPQRHPNMSCRVMGSSRPLAATRSPTQPLLTVLPLRALRRAAMPHPAPAALQVPMDKPRNALQMITAFTRNEPLVPPSSTAVASGTTTPAPDATGSASGSAGAPKRAQRAETLLGATWTIRQGRKEGPGEGAQEVLAQK